MEVGEAKDMGEETVGLAMAAAQAVAMEGATDWVVDAQEGEALEEVATVEAAPKVVEARAAAAAAGAVMVVTTVEEDRWAAHRHTTLDMSARVARCGRVCSQARRLAGKTAQESESLLPSQSKPIHCLRTSDRQHIQVAGVARVAPVAWVEMMVAPWVACLVAALA